MSISLRTKYLSIKKEKLSETAKGVLKSMYDATDGFKDVKATRKIKPKFEAFYDKLVKAKPEAIKGATKPKETSSAKQFKEARERRKSQAGVPKKESDIERDADRPAIDRKGKRVTDGTHYPYKKGNVYYEYRDNRYDKRPAKFPKLEDGGMMADGGHVQGYDDREDERLSMEHGKMADKDLNSTHARRDDAQFEERMADGGELDNYTEVNGTFYKKGTPQGVINALESARNNRTRVKLFYGDPETGRDWHEENDTTGTIGRSTGSIKIPLLIPTSRSSGGGAILTKNIVKIRDTKSGKVLYQNENYKQPNIEIVESTTDGYTHDVIIDGELYSRHKSLRSAEMLKSKMMADGGMMAHGGETHRSQGGDLFADGGTTDNGNVEMVMSNTKAIQHHAEELKKLVDMNTPIEAWVVAKLERAETDLSDVTHYIDGLKSAKYADGGELDGHDVEIFYNSKAKVADPYTIVIDGSVYSMSGTSGPMSVNMYAGEIDEFEPQAVKGWGKKINFVNADPELIKQIESRFEEYADGGSIQDVEKYVADKYFNGDKRGFSVSKIKGGKHELNIDNIESFEEEYGDYNEEVSKIENDINKKFADGGMMAKGGETDYSKQTSDDFKLGEIVWDTDNKRYGTIIGIYDGYLSDKYEVRLDTDGMQPTENLRKLGCEGDKGTKEQLKDEIDGYARLVKSYPKNNYPKQIEPKMSDGGYMADGGTIAEKTSVEVGNEKISVIKRRKEKTGYPVYVNSQGYAPITLDVYPTKELAKKKAKALANKEGYTFSNWEKVGEFKLEPYKKGGTLKTKAKYIPKYQIEEVEVDINGKEKEIDGADLLDGLYVKKAAVMTKKAAPKKAKGGEVKAKSNRGGNVKEIVKLAKEIRKDGEKWTDAVKRASAQLKK